MFASSVFWEINWLFVTSDFPLFIKENKMSSLFVKTAY